MKAPAKLNLRLKVTGRRPDDGYHVLSMFNVTVGLHDEVFLALSDGAGIRLAVEGVEGEFKDELSNPERNIVGRAALKFLAEFGFESGLDIRLVKRIPAGAGLGGGSSDAAAVLKLLQAAFAEKLLNQGISGEALQGKICQIALELGADVPYFLSGGFAYVSGIGEKVQPLDARFLKGVEVFILKPAESINTALVYQRFRSTVQGESLVEDLAAAKFIKNYSDMSDLRFRELFYSLIENDLTETVFNVSSRVSEILRELRKTFEDEVYCGVSGSGSAMFLLPSKGKRLSPGIAEKINEFAVFNELSLYQSSLLAI